MAIAPQKISDLI